MTSLGLGDHLLTTNGLAETSTLLAGKKFVALYFSAHWCPPCRGFTPVLAKLYEANAEANNTEVVFVSSDQDEASFQKYFGSMPWLALPYSSRDAKAKLSQKYGVRGIPTLVILDGKTGKLVTTQGRAEVETYFGAKAAAAGPETDEDDSRGAKAAAAGRVTDEDDEDDSRGPLEALLGGELLSKADGPTIKTSTALAAGKHKYVGLYFSAHWCPPCRGFTPTLAKLYSSASASDTEVVFISSDRDVASMKSYFGEMPWLALPFTDRDRKAALCDKFGIRGIPTLVILDGSTGELVTKDGRSQVDKFFAKGGRRPSQSCSIM